MINAPPGRPIENNAPRALERFHVYLLLVLGVALIGVGITAMGFATLSPAAVGIGVGGVVAAGLMAIFFALAGPLLTGQERVSKDAAEARPPTRDSDLENERVAWPP
jgi:amino acid transporter